MGGIDRNYDIVTTWFLINQYKNDGTCQAFRIILLKQNFRMSKKCAVVFGANGISGIAMTKVLLASDEWSPIICVSRRPPQLEEAAKDSRIKFVSIDMVQSSADDLASKLSAAGAAIAQHAFFYAYIEKQDFKELNDINKMLLEKALQALSLVSPKLKSFMLQTGSKVISCRSYSWASL